MTCTSPAILLQKTGTNLELGQKVEILLNLNFKMWLKCQKSYTQLSLQNIGDV